MEKLRQDARIDHIDGGLLHPLFLTDPVEFFHDIIVTGNFREVDQLFYYAKALAQITGKKVKEAVIYSLALQKEIPVPINL